jgi:hypothetical protein
MHKNAGECDGKTDSSKCEGINDMKTHRKEEKRTTNG